MDKIQNSKRRKGGSFPGTFSLKQETMVQVLFELFENMSGFSFQHIYCFNYHGDAAHVEAIIKAIIKANEALSICCKLVVNAMDLSLYGWHGDEPFLLVVDPEYPMEWFLEGEPSEAGLLDIHGGAFETAVINYLCPELVDLEKAQELPSTSLNEEGLLNWLKGGDAAKHTVPLGYAGNPAGYQTVGKHVEEMLTLQTEDIARQIVRLI